MRNIIQYVKDFGHKSFTEFPFNEVDSLILSQISYLNLDEFIPTVQDNKASVRLIDILSDKVIQRMCKDTLDEKKNIRLLKAIRESARFEQVHANYFLNLFHVEKIEQFCAVTFQFENFSYIAYRGTDLTLLGWYEDFNMALMDQIPAQEDASKYLDIVCSLLGLNEMIYIGGHSKGGNLAVYAAVFCSEYIKKRIIRIYDHDGPGFHKDIFNTKEYLSIEHKIAKTTCKESMVGILLIHTEKMEFVDSSGIGIMQHDPFNWKINKDGRFKKVKKANFFSKTFEKSSNEFIESTSIEDRKKFFDMLFKVAMEKDNSTIFDFKKHPFKYFRGIKKRYHSLSEKDRIFFKKMLKRYRALSRHNFRLLLKKNMKLKNKKDNQTDIIEEIYD
ncbi:MAG: DUF2974 domain-containing protein [Anaeroplasmataceae bacterium]|nr:DUF2974 domain-containing protein [Anaeroplasmataceae bacterium]